MTQRNLGQQFTFVRDDQTPDMTGLEQDAQYPVTPTTAWTAVADGPDGPVPAGVVEYHHGGIFPRSDEDFDRIKDDPDVPAGPVPMFESHRGMVTNLAVDPQFRGSGLSLQLTNRAVDHHLATDGKHDRPDDISFIDPNLSPHSSGLANKTLGRQETQATWGKDEAKEGPEHFAEMTIGNVGAPLAHELGNHVSRGGRTEPGTFIAGAMVPGDPEEGEPGMVHEISVDREPSSSLEDKLAHMSEYTESQKPKRRKKGPDLQMRLPGI
jgi:hypothetical protein